MYPIILNDYIDLQHKATYAIRDLIKTEEQKFAESEKLQFTENYGRLHDVAKYAMVLCEILEVNVKTFEYVVQCHEHLQQQVILPEGSPAATEDTASIHTTHQYLRFYAHMVYRMHCRCDSYRDRMKNQIQLVFNAVAQKEARASATIALATKADSETMKATSIVALVFLPPTFVSAVFGTTFFQFGADSRSWEVSDKFWLYWAVVVPITMVCVAVSYVCFYRDASPGVDLIRQRNVELSHLKRRYGNIQSNGFLEAQSLSGRGE